jgi:hypothetical protein
MFARDLPRGPFSFVCRDQADSHGFTCISIAASSKKRRPALCSHAFP